MFLIEMLFWFSALIIFYSYLGYPVFLWLISLFKKSNGAQDLKPFRPKVTLLISVYNEEEVIEEKLRNSLDLNYPRDLLEIVVISDGSTDRTHEIVSRFRDKGVRLQVFEGRIGKTACLNKAVPLAGGKIVLFSDANSKYQSDAIHHLVKNFANPSIGFVTGSTLYLSKKGDSTEESIGLYAKIEKWIKTMESQIDSCVGADGAIFAIRKELYRPLKSIDINDFVIPLNVIEQGYRGKLEENALCYEVTAGGAQDEFRRQVRINNRTIRAIMNYRHLLNPFRFGFFSFEFFSHKMCRFLVPFFIMILFATNLVLIGKSPVYLFLFSAHLTFYLLVSLSYIHYEIKGLTRLIAFSHTFAMVNVAILFGWAKYLKGETSVTWIPTAR